uniref:Uncharacterized protein n=1 Tax=Setaria viridis TaxID=4556 RepID=A0A4U6SSD3_SETVI|nr:hypothetical protein SEVIR_9G060750v2 [Setaria viridis]
MRIQLESDSSNLVIALKSRVFAQSTAGSTRFCIR